MYTSCVIEIRSWPVVVGDLPCAQACRVEARGDKVPERMRVQPLPGRARDDLAELLGDAMRKARADGGGTDIRLG
jgi:hypothetical protein